MDGRAGGNLKRRQLVKVKVVDLADDGQCADGAAEQALDVNCVGVGPTDHHLVVEGLCIQTLKLAYCHTVG